MPNLYLPVAAAVISAILLIVYCSKKRLKIRENALYLAMLIAIMCDSVLVSGIFISVYTDFNEKLIVLFNKIDYNCLITWATCLFLYTYMVIHKGDASFEKKYKIACHYLTVPFALLSTIVMWTMDVELVMIDAIKATAQGPAVYFTISVCLIFFLASLATIVTNPKKVSRRVIPVFVSIVITVVIAIMFTFNPYLICISMGLTIVNLTMYFTIENPDVQLLTSVNAARDEAQRANQAKTDFLSSMSHEIRTPLNAIVGLSECILTEPTLEKAREDARDIVNASNNLLELVNGILDISKIEAGKMELVNKEYDLTEAATGLVKLIKTRIGDKNLVLNTTLSDDIPGVLYGDEAKIKEIITNLLTNAVKYTDKGHIDFSITSRNDKDTAHLVILVADTGRGIKKEVIHTLFDKFKRLDEDRNTAIEGTGLGLAITKQLVEMMDGKIEVQSEYGEGTEFKVTIAQQIRSMEHVKREQTEQNVETYPGKRILVVDDNQINIKVESRLLEKYELYADSAQSGEECIGICKMKQYDLILMDDMMPGMNGTETMKKLKENPFFVTPVVILTANAIEGTKNEYLEAGFDDYLAKPIDKHELRRVLREYLT